MEQGERLKKLLQIEGVVGFAYINSEDGNLIHSGGITPGNIDEIVAFIGSASDIIARSFNNYPYREVRIEGKDKIVIFRFQENYLGCILEELKDKIIDDIKAVLEEEDITGDPAVLRVFKGKARQISLLLEEFSKGSDPEKWSGLVSRAAIALDRENKFSELLVVDGIKMSVKGAKGLTKEDVNKYMKLLLDFIVKEAIKEFGSDEAKRRVHTVIEKLSGEKK